MWIKVVAPSPRPHHCNYPNPTMWQDWDPKIAVGSIWKCDCGQEWKLYSLTAVDGYAYPRYRQSPKWYDTMRSLR